MATIFDYATLRNIYSFLTTGKRPAAEVVTASVVTTSANNGTTQKDYEIPNGYKGVLVIINSVGAASGGSPSLTVSVKNKNPINSAYTAAVATSGALGAGTAETILKIYPAETAVGGATNAHLYRTFAIEEVLNNAGSSTMTYSISLQYLP